MRTSLATDRGDATCKAQAGDWLDVLPIAPRPLPDLPHDWRVTIERPHFTNERGWPSAYERSHDHESQEESMMCDTPENSEHGSAVKGCAVCSGKFGLIRYYSWRTPLCSRKCLDRFRARRERDRRWLFRFQAA
jgi:hypothetical protein